MEHENAYVSIYNLELDDLDIIYGEDDELNGVVTEFKQVMKLLLKRKWRDGNYR